MPRNTEWMAMAELEQREEFEKDVGKCCLTGIRKSVNINIVCLCLFVFFGGEVSVVISSYF